MTEQLSANFYTGVDIGSTTTKCVILDGNGKTVTTSILPTGKNINEVSTKIVDICTRDLGITHNDITNIVTTGYGRYIPHYSFNVLPEIQAIGLGMFQSHGKEQANEWPKLILDIGGQDCKVLTINEKGMIENFVTNEKCSAGTGKFIEFVSRCHGLTWKKMSEIANESKNRCELKSKCGIFIESEMRRCLQKGSKLEDVLSGLFYSLRDRIFAILNKIEFTTDTLYFTGGVSQNEFLVSLLKERFREVIVPQEPQLVCARGAAHFAQHFSKSQG